MLQPGTGPPSLSRLEPNEICTHQDLGTQTQWRLPVHVFVFLKGIGLKGGIKSNEEKFVFSNIPSGTCMCWRRTGAKHPPSASPPFPGAGSRFRGPRHCPALNLSGPITPKAILPEGRPPLQAASELWPLRAAGGERRAAGGQWRGDPAPQPRPLIFRRPAQQGSPDLRNLGTRLSRGPAGMSGGNVVKEP